MRWLRALAEKAAVVRLSSRSGGFDLLPKLVGGALCSWFLGRRAHTRATTALTPSITRAAAWHLPVAWFRSFKVAAFLVFFLVWFGSPSCLTTSVSLSTSSRRVPPPSLAMTTVTAKDVYVSWNGDLNTWPDFVRKVRLQYEKTQPSKRYLLGPELVSRLTDKAWQASYEIDHDRLSGRHGVKYMLSFLRDKLCRAPVPDAGARLEDLLIRLRRQPGTPFAQWAHEVREHYRRLQRALLRARQEAQPKETSMKKSSKGSSKKSHGSTATEPEPRPSSTGSDHSPSRSVRSREPAIPEDEEQEEGEEDEVDDGSPSNRGGWNTWWQWGNQWTAEEWNEWLGKKKKHDGSDSWSAYAEDDEDMNVPWDELEVNDAEVLPDEVLGWILLRRAGLSTQSRLSVQASVGNSLKFEAIERALRDQEEELLAAERRPVGGKGHGYKGSAPRRTFWVEQDREWGLLDGEPDEELQVHWVGHKLPDDVYQHPAPVHEPTPEEEETYWGSASWDDGSWTTSSAWWNDTEAEFEFSPEEQKQIDEVYAAYEDKVRTFVQARNLMKSKTNNRGFFPMVKGKFSKGKGSFKGKQKGGPSPVMAASSFQGSSSPGKGRQRPGEPDYTGCFICGARDHSFQQCPKRHQRKGGGSAHYVDVLYASLENDTYTTNEFDSSVFMAQDDSMDAEETISAWTVQPSDDQFHAVIDCGATETVASLHALTAIMNRRQSKFGYEEIRVNQDVRKTFKFGNGRTLQATSYVEIPQSIGGTHTWLGVHALDTDDRYVPLLLGMRTLERLAAVIDFGSKTASFCAVSDELVPLQQCQRTGHLLLDLSSDWLDARFDEVYVEHLSSSQAMVVENSNHLDQAEAGHIDDFAHEYQFDEPFVPPPSHQELLPSEPLVLAESPTSAGFGFESEVCEGTNPGISHDSHVRDPVDYMQSTRDTEEGDGEGEIQRAEEPEAARRPDLRLRQEGRAGSQRSSVQRRTVQGPACGSHLWTWLSIREERMCNVEDMSELHASPRVHPSIWRSCQVQECRSSQHRHQGPADREGERDREGPFCASYSGGGFGWRREESPSTFGDHPEAEGGPEEGQDQGRAPSHENHYTNSEEVEEDWFSRCRGTGSSSGGVGRLLDRDASDGCELTTPESVKCLVAETMNDTTTAINDSLHEFVNLSFDSMPGVVLFSPEARSLDLLEVCCPPDSALAAMVERLGGSSARVTEHNMNLNSVDGLTQAISFVRREKPRWMWLSLPCGANSPIQHLNELTEQAWLKSLARRKKSRKLVRRALQLLRVHVFENGGHFGWEWPKTNDGWHQKELKDFFKEVHEKKQNLFRTLLHGCQVGVVNDKNEPVLKPWTIYVTDRAMASALHLVCPHDHQHGEAMGGQSAKKTGFYPPRMVRIIARQILRRDLPPHVETVQEKDEEALLAYGVSEIETVVPDGVSPVEWKRVLALVKRLHVRAGHPSTSLVATLKARGAHPLITLAAKYMHCDDCAETKRSVPAARASFNRSDTLWHTLQVDNAYFKVGTKTVTAMIMVDEASTFMVPHLLHRLDEGEHENATAEQVVDALQNSWIRFFGHPSVLRLDPEGAFRSRLLEDFCGTRDIELQPCAAEAHYQIGVVERAIGTLRKSVERFLRSNAVDPWEAIVTMCAAHNEVGKIAGFSPAQWALGRSLGIDEKIHESGREATSFHESQRASQDRVQKTMVLRLKAEQEYKKNMAQEAINRAWNSKAQKREIWTPGALIYYKRYKAPSTSLASHKDVDVTRRQIARWYGPGRVVATESFLDGDSARPGHIVWITAGGRLKRVAPEQLRLASETEKILAEADGPPRFDWTIQGMLQEVDRGQFDVYDDLLQPSPATPARRSRSAAPPVRGSSARSRTPVMKREEPTRSHVDPISRKRPQENSDVRPLGDSKRKSGKEMPLGTGQAQSASGSVKGTSHPGGSRMVSLEATPNAPSLASSDFSPGRYLSDPSCEFPTSHGAAGKSWTGELKRNELFKKAQERHGEAKMVEETSFACESLQPEDGQGEPPLFVAMSLELPTDEKSMKQFKRDPVTWTANKLKKHVEVKMEHLTPEQVEDMKKAKSLEVGQWIQAAACKALEEHQIAPRSQTMRMRWVLTFKSSGAAKARIVIVGFSDPDLGSLSTTSPTMSRRTRQLMMTMASCCGWSQVKCDAKSAFLQTSENTEEHRSVFAVPVPELAMAMGVEPGRAVQVVKSCYGLCNAPHQWYLEVRNKILELGGEALKTEPCCWRIKDPSTNSVVGLVGSHVDDFYMIGDDGNETWNLFLHRFKASYRWSPWECDSFDHCGVQLHQTPSKEIILDHAKFCTGIQQISITTKDPKAPATPQEVEQLRAVLGAAQWRVVQSGPQHGAKLSQLQSRITKADGQTLAEASKLVREIYNDRMLSPKTQVLECSPDEVEFVAWSDAALANRVDMGSTGGYVVGATTKDLREGKKARVNFVGWKTFKLKRIARSSLAAEVQAFSEAEEELMFTRLQWGEMLGHDLDPRSPEDVLVRVPGILVTDAKSLYDSVQKGLVNTSGLGLSEKYSALELLSVMERLDRGHTETRWVNSDAQLADALTKHQCQSSLHQALVQGHWILVYDPLFVSAKKRKAAKLGPKA